MSRTQTLQVPQHLAGTDLRPVLTLLPVAATSPHGGAEAKDDGPGKGPSVARAAAVVAVGAHLAGAGLALKEALGYSDFVWDTAGIARTPWLARIALVPVVGARQFSADVKPRLEQASAAIELQGG
ncbi:hypothetical protein KSP35_22820 [Aquihabitans sp. G128]|uniref:hypothetical protein n=1 Tax=Aquihabitans sp. G128 TaxID=2849779 RepID=UPI001C234E18|nr:hypothetical protein [Aquihabitans sp. G128]QXC61111.1 hypothetical protein KSP35_22820 [Aquihabitans sp. G128]